MKLAIQDFGEKKNNNNTKNWKINEKQNRKDNKNNLLPEKRKEQICVDNNKKQIYL